MITRIAPLLGLLAGLVPGLASAGGDPPLGEWLTQDRAAVIDIAPCGPALCGRIVGVTLDHPNDPMPVDAHGRPQCGQTIITDMRPTDPNLWKGHIADPRNDHVYRAELWVDRGVLRLHGYVGLPLFGATQGWTRFAGRIGANCLM